jgi:hypothetical protein
MDNRSESEPGFFLGNRKVLVTGLGRGGTSAIGALLFHAGFNMSGDGNVDDVYFEDERLRSMLLASDFERLEAELTFRTAKHPLVAWKDPKLYSGQGLQLVQRLPRDWIVIAVFRDPVAIVSRRLVTDESSFAESMSRVLRFMRKLYEFLAEVEKSKTVIYVSYEKLITEPVASISRILHLLGAKVDDEHVGSLWTKTKESQKTYLNVVSTRLPSGSDASREDLSGTQRDQSS